jgi:hypothetical protein
MRLEGARMGGLRRPAPAGAVVRLVALVMLLAPLLAPSLALPSNALAAGCNGDEQILLAPAQPRVGSPMIVAAVSRFAHEQVLMLGPAGPLIVTREPMGERFIWPATVVPDQAGDFLFAFGVVSGPTGLATCANTIVTVAGVDILAPGDRSVPTDPNGTPGTTALAPSVLLPSLHPWLNGAQTTPDAAPDSPDGTPDGGVDPSGTPRPTRTPTRHNASDNGNENDNEDNDNTTDPTPTRTPTSTREPTATRTPTETRTPTPTRTPRPDPTDTATPTPRPDPTDTPIPTATLAPASIDGLSPSTATCGQTLIVRGQRFGATRGAVDGQVYVDDREAEIVSWEMAEIEIRVPRTARPGNDRTLEVVVAGHTTSRTGVRINC